MNFFVRMVNVLVVYYYVMVNSFKSFIFTYRFFFIGVAHCLDGSDENPNLSCFSNPGESLHESNNRPISTKHQRWRGISIGVFLLLIFVVFILFMAYFIFRRYVKPPIPLINDERKNYATIVNSRMFEILFKKKIYLIFLSFK
jgi:hypothetical protein